MKKFKTVLKIWTIVYVLITTLIYALSEWLVLQPIYIRTLVLSGVMVFGLQYVVFPIMNQLKIIK